MSTSSGLRIRAPTAVTIIIIIISLLTQFQITVTLLSDNVLERFTDSLLSFVINRPVEAGATLWGFNTQHIWSKHIPSIPSQIPMRLSLESVSPSDVHPTS